MAEKYENNHRFLLVMCSEIALPKSQEGNAKNNKKSGTS